MQAVRALVRQAGLVPAGVRSFGAGNAKAISEGNAHGSPAVDMAGTFIVIPVAIGAIIADAMYPEEEFEGTIPQYPYMRMRAAKLGYPWGPNGLFEYHPRVKPAAE